MSGLYTKQLAPLYRRYHCTVPASVDRFKCRVSGLLFCLLHCSPQHLHSPHRMEGYAGKDEQALRKLLDNTTDYTERRKIRTAIRELKKAASNNNNNNNLTQKSTISVNIDSGTSQSKLQNVETTVTRLRQEGDGGSGQKSDDESRVTMTRYRRRMQLEEEKEKEKSENKEEETTARLEDIDDEEVLSKMLKETTVYEERKKIRIAIKELRNRKEAQAKSSVSLEILPSSSKSGSHGSVTTGISLTRQEQSTSHQRKTDEEGDSVERAGRKKDVDVDKKTEELSHNIDDITDENVLKQMLKETEDYELKKRIRVALREIRKKARESKVQEAETKETTNGATHKSNVTLQLENKDLEKRNGDVRVGEVAEVTVKPAVSSPKVRPKMVIRTHSFKKLDKFDVPEAAKKEETSVVSRERIELNDTAKKDDTDNLWDKRQMSDNSTAAKDTLKDSPKTKTKISTSTFEPKKDSLRPNKTAIEIQVQKVDSRGLWDTPTKEEPKKNSFEDVDDLATLENLLLKTTKADERLEIRARIRELKMRKPEKVSEKPEERRMQQQSFLKQENRTIVPRVTKDSPWNAENSVKVDTIEERPDANTKITTTVMRLRDSSKDGEEVKQRTVVEQKSDSGVKKMTKTFMLKTNGENQQPLTVQYGEETPKTRKTVVSRSIVAKETTDDYSSCYTSEEEEETVVKTDDKGTTHTSKTRVTLQKMEVSDRDRDEDKHTYDLPTHDRKPAALASSKTFRKQKRFESDSESSDDDVDGGALSRKAISTESRKVPETKGVTTAKFKTQVGTRLQHQSPTPMKDDRSYGAKQTEQSRKFQGKGEDKEIGKAGSSSKEELEKEYSNMAPTPIEELEDEAELERMLDATTDFDERRKIRTRLREVRRKRREERDRKMAQREKEREQEKRDRMAAADKKFFGIVNAGGPRFSGSVSTSTSSSTSKTDSNANTTKTDDTSNANTTKTIVAKKDEPESKSVTKTTEEKTEGGTTMKKTTTVTETKGDGSSSSMSVTKTSSSSSSSTGGTSGRRMSKFEEELEARRKAREEKRDLETKKFKEESVKRQTAAERRKQEAMAAKNKRSAIMDKFGGAAKTGPAVGGGGGPRMQVQNANTIKTMLLDWCKTKTQGYPNCEVTNFSSSWSNGMAFCALVHHYFPDAYDYNTLNPKNRRYNFNLAFTTAEKCADICPLLDTEDMIMMGNKPDWKCVFCYVQSLYRNLNKRD
ncbi:smoothelin-like isoform X2 [Ptychodera flava]|uniref:smoothelin-like isoform X2 n=1 Tax=Ptychodera flava TaxID=63121 RepID=UPI00396A892C